MTVRVAYERLNKSEIDNRRTRIALKSYMTILYPTRAIKRYSLAMLKSTLSSDVDQNSHEMILRANFNIVKLRHSGKEIHVCVISQYTSKLVSVQLQDHPESS